MISLLFLYFNHRVRPFYSPERTCCVLAVRRRSRAVIDRAPESPGSAKVSSWFWGGEKKIYIENRLLADLQPHRHSRIVPFVYFPNDFVLRIRNEMRGTLSLIWMCVWLNGRFFPFWADICPSTSSFWRPFLKTKFNKIIDGVYIVREERNSCGRQWGER